MDISISALTAAGTDEITVSFLLCDGAHSEAVRRTIPTEVYMSLGLSKGESSQDIFEIVGREAKIYSAYKRALYILGFASCSKRTLLSKLTAKGFERESAIEAVARADAAGYIDESAGALREAQIAVQKLWGETRIRAFLSQKGYSKEDIDAAVFIMLDEGVDFDTNCSLLLKSKLSSLSSPLSPKEKQRLIASVCRYGYSLSQIKRAMNEQS